MTKIIAGPCGFESYEMAEEIISKLTEMGIEYVRGGANKYRSNPDDYQGTTEVYSWIKRLKEKYNFKFVNEVFTPMEYQTFGDVIDIAQVGSRNMHNTDLLKYLNNYCKQPIILKRHYAAGLTEFINHSRYIGNDKKVILGVRGILSLFPGEQRFQPDIADIDRLRYLLVERELLSNKEFMVDVSHMGCERRYIPKLIMTAMLYEPEYIMIEVHNNPINAKSDANQQLTIDHLQELINRGIINV